MIERRIHKVYLTRNTEYHVRRDRCVAVRDRQSGKWMRSHIAVDGVVQGSLRFSLKGAIAAGTNPTVGHSLYLDKEGQDVITSPVLGIERPRRETLQQYSQLDLRDELITKRAS